MRSVSESAEEMLRFSQVEPLKNNRLSIAVHIHLYYEDLLEEFIGYLKNIPYSFDLFVSCRKDADALFIRDRLRTIKNAGKITVRGVENRGRDLLPFYVTFGRELSKYDYLLHAHSKKSLYTGGEKLGWRQNSMNALSGSATAVRRIFALFEKKGVGLVYPENYDEVPSAAYHWLKNAGNGQALLSRMGIPFVGGVFLYPAGSFFWAKTDAIRQVFDLHLTKDDFPEEARQIDGTLAHALERVIGIVSRFNGYKDCLIDFRASVFRLGFSRLPFMHLLNDRAFVLEQLKKYETVSFDIFDTLITRLCFEPDDLFLIMQKKIEASKKRRLNFLKIRKDAENAAWQKKGAFTNIDDIYEMLPSVSDFSEPEAEELKVMEIELELDLAVPRRDMLWIFNMLRENGNKIILVSDMYLKKGIIARMLEKCGYSGWNEMYISCEEGARKDSESMWGKIFGIYDKNRFVHCGDNFRSDCQAVGDIGAIPMPVFNPRDELEVFRVRFAASWFRRKCGAFQFTVRHRPEHLRL